MREYTVGKVETTVSVEINDTVETIVTVETIGRYYFDCVSLQAQIVSTVALSDYHLLSHNSLLSQWQLLTIFISFC